MQLRRLSPAILVFLLAQLHAAPSGADFLLLEPNARASGMGGAASARREWLEGLRFNPASLAGIEGVLASLSHNTAPGDWTHDWAGVSLKAGSVVVGAELLFSSVEPFDLYDSDGMLTAEAQAGSQNLMLAAALPIGSWLSLGAGVRYFRSQLYTYQSQGMAADLGLLADKKGWPLSAGLALRNLGFQSAYFSEADPLPLALRCSLMAHLALEKHLTFNPSLEVMAFADPSRPLEIRAGLEAVFFSKLALRTGLQRAGSFQQFSFGGGLQWQGWGVDYAFLPGSEMGASHSIGLNLRAGK